MAAHPNLTTRALKADDLGRVIEIDRRLVGRSRRGFFENRLEAALAVPEDFVVTGVTEEDRLIGFAIARLHEGDFGMPGKLAVLDAIGVDADCQARGVGRLLMASLDAQLKKRGVAEIRTETDWRFHGLMGFFDAAGFSLAPAHILERAAKPII